MSAGILGSLPSFAVSLGLDPAEKPRIISVPALLKTNPEGTFAELLFDLSTNSALSQITSVQGVFLDLADVAAAYSVMIRHVRSGFRIQAKGQTQGWYTMPANDELRFTVRGPIQMNGFTVPIWFTNAPPFINQWPSA